MYGYTPVIILYVQMRYVGGYTNKSEIEITCTKYVLYPCMVAKSHMYIQDSNQNNQSLHIHNTYVCTGFIISSQLLT